MAFLIPAAWSSSGLDEAAGRRLCHGREPKIMTISGEESQDWKETLVDWVGARWRWLIVAVVLLFAFNNLVGLVVGITGLIAFANSVVGRVLRARNVVQQVQQIVTNPDDLREEAGPKRPVSRPDRFTVMDLTPDEQPVVRRAVAAYKAKKRQKGTFRGTTADEILEELKPSPVRWTELAAFVIEKAKGPTRRN
jgi:hypothetical protein